VVEDGTDLRWDVERVHYLRCQGRHASGAVTRLGRLIVFTLVTVVAAGVRVHPAVAETARELTAEADRLIGAHEGLPPSLQKAIALYERAAQLEPVNAEIQIKLAEAALELGGSAADGLAWYKVGERAGERAVALNELNAHGHYLLAANRGHVAKRRSIIEARPSIVGDLEQHLLRALALDARHARALHMMAILLRDTPLLVRLYLKGKRSDVERYLVAAVDADQNFPQARLDLAELYRSTGRPALARSQARAVLEMASSPRERLWREKYRRAAVTLLRRLPAD